MKQLIHTLFIGLILFITVLSCVKEDMDKCPVEPGPNIDSEGEILLNFKCINENYLFPDIVEDLELLFYDLNGILAYTLRFNREELREMDWKVLLSEETGEKEGAYQIVTLVNYRYEDHIQVTGKENQNQFIATIDRDMQNWVNYKLKDTYHGTIHLTIKYVPKKTDEYTIYLSKNTNTIKLTIEFDDKETPEKLVTYRSYISGNNGGYLWDNLIPPIYETVYYKHYESTFGDHQPVIEDFIKTMRIWTDADIRLNMEFQEGSIPYRQELNIPALLARVEKDGVRLYDTDEKLEHHDFFEITVRVGSHFVIASIMINGWFLIEDDIDI